MAVNHSKASIWFHAIRPKTLPAALAPVIIGLAMAYARTKSFGDGGFNIWIAVVTAVCALLIQIGTNLANDYFDFIKGTDNEKRVGPIRATQAGLVSGHEMLLAFIITFALAGCFGIILIIQGGWPVLVTGIAAIICGILYTAGPRPLGYIGLGELFVLIFFGPVAVAGTYYLQTLEIELWPVIMGIAAGLFSTAILVANNLRDIETDRAAGRKNLIILFGYKFGAAQYYFCVLVAFLIPVIITLITRAYYICLISLLAILLEIRPLRTVVSRPLPPPPQKLIVVLVETGRALLVFSLLFSAGWIASV